VNLAALAAGGATLLEQAIATSGTTVTISRDSDDQDETVDSTPSRSATRRRRPIATDVAALIVTAAATDVPVGTDRTLAEPTFRVFFPVTVTDVQQRPCSPSPPVATHRLTGAQLLVTAVLDDALGVRRQLEARRR
jgi:hypothetical protein